MNMRLNVLYMCGKGGDVCVFASVSGIVSGVVSPLVYCQLVVDFSNKLGLVRYMGKIIEWQTYKTKKINATCKRNKKTTTLELPLHRL